jgi:hypothetical protein
VHRPVRSKNRFLESGPHLGRRDGNTAARHSLRHSHGRKITGFAVIAILTLALGIGANTALFSVVNGVLLNPLPYEQPDRLVAIYSKSSEFPRSLDWVREQRSFSSLAAFREDDYNLTAMGESERVKAEMILANFFSLLGVKPVVGRLFLPEEDRRWARVRNQAKKVRSAAAAPIASQNPPIR